MNRGLAWVLGWQGERRWSRAPDARAQVPGAPEPTSQSPAPQSPHLRARRPRAPESRAQGLSDVEIMVRYQSERFWGQELKNPNCLRVLKIQTV